jgi:16S rRNA processing protein RimM
MPRPRICVGAIAGAHGVKGLVKIKSFTEEPDGVAAYGPLSDEAGEREFTLALTGRAKGLIIARIDGVEDRNAAEALRGTRLYVERAALPPTAEEAYYHTDLIGLEAVGMDGAPVAVGMDGAPVGEVKALYNYGAGDVIEIQRRDKDLLLLPFTKAAVPEVDLEGGRLVVREPEET